MFQSPLNYIKDGKKTDKVAGYDYTVAEISTYDVLTVRVHSLTPLIDPADLKKSGKFPLVKFSEDAVAKPVTAQYATRKLRQDDLVETLKSGSF